MKVEISIRQAQLDNLTARLNSGTAKLYSGVKPANSSTALLGTNILLGTLTFAAVAFPPSVNSANTALATANAVTPGVAVNAPAGLLCTFARCYKSDGVTVVCDLLVGATGSGAEMVLNPPLLVTGVTVTCSSATMSLPDGS